MALAKLDDSGGPVAPPATKPGSSSPPPNAGKPPKNQPSNTNNGKKPDAGKNKNEKQPDAKKSVAPQPVTAPKGETLEQAITRMRNEQVPEWQIKEQIKKWHPGWTEAHIAKTMKAAPRPGDYIDQAKANAARGKSTKHPNGGSALSHLGKRIVHAVEDKSRPVRRATHSVTHELGRDVRNAKSVTRKLEHGVTRTVRHDLKRDVQHAKAVAEHPVRTIHGLKHEVAKHVADPVKKHIIRPIEHEAAEEAKELRTSLRAVRREFEKQSGRLSRDIEKEVPRIERRIEHDLALLDKDVLRHLPSARAIAEWTGTFSSFAALAGLVLPPPADVAAEAIAVGLAEVSITASTVDAIKHPNDPGKTIDALVQIGLVRLGVSGGTRDERRVRGGGGADFAALLRLLAQAWVGRLVVKPWMKAI